MDGIEDTAGVMETKDLEAARRATIQKPRVDYSGTGNLLVYLASGVDTLPAWWSKQRDRELRKFWKQCPHLAGAIYMLQAKLTSVPVRVEARDPSSDLHVRQAEQFTRILVEESQFGQGWVSCFGRFLQDLWCSDNGAFLEVIGDGPPDGPIVGPPLGLAHLDSIRCHRTSDPEYPVVYESMDGKLHKLHYTRVVYMSQMPSPDIEMKGVGFCAVSRASAIAQNLIDIARYKQEKLGSRPLRGVLLAKGIATSVVKNALSIANEQMDAEGLSRFARLPVIGDIPSDADMSLLNLASLPDGYDEREAVTLGMFAIALAFGVPPRWLWPATVVGATRADAMYQHVAGLGGGAGQILRAVTILLGGSERGARHMTGKFLPPHLRLVFDFQDDEEDRLKAEIRETRARTRERNLMTGVTNLRLERLKMLEDGEISEAQFEELELQSGRLPDGRTVLDLFYERDAATQSLLDIGIADPPVAAEYDPESVLEAAKEKLPEVHRYAAATNDPRRKRRALAAVAALEHLISICEERMRSDEPIPLRDVGQEERAEEKPKPPTGLQEGEPDEGEEEPLDKEVRRDPFGYKASPGMGAETGPFVSRGQRDYGPVSYTHLTLPTKA